MWLFVNVRGTRYLRVELSEVYFLQINVYIDK